MRGERVPDEVLCEFGSGSGAAHQAAHLASRLPEVKLTKFVEKLTFGLEGRLIAGKRPCSEAASHACC